MYTGLAVATTSMCGLEVVACLISIFDDPNIDSLCVTDEYGNTRCGKDIKVPGWACIAEAGLVITGNDPYVKLVEKFLDECAKWRVVD
jgi:hypothetical protein